MDGKGREEGFQDITIDSHTHAITLPIRGFNIAAWKQGSYALHVLETPCGPLCGVHSSPYLLFYTPFIFLSDW